MTKIETLKEAQAYIEQLLTEKGDLIIAAAKAKHARKVAEKAFEIAADLLHASGDQCPGYKNRDFNCLGEDYCLECLCEHLKKQAAQELAEEERK